MNVRDVMVPLVESVHPDDTLRDASEKMNALDLDPLPVTEGGKLVGVVSHGALQDRASREGLGAGSIRVREVMSGNTYCVRDDMELPDAARHLKQEHGSRPFARIPVIDAGGELVGSVLVETLVKQLSETAPDAGEAAVFAVESISSIADFDEDSVDYMSDESFPASDPPSPPTTLGPAGEGQGR